MKNNDLKYKDYTDIEYYNNGAIDAVIPEEENPYEYQLKQNKNYMNNVALVTEKGEKITYEEFHTRVDEYARALKLKGVNEGDRIAVASANTPSGLYLKRALYKLGATVCAINPIEPLKAMEGDIELVNPKMFIGVNLFSKKFSTVTKRYGTDSLYFSPFDSVKMSMKEKALVNLFMLYKGCYVFDSKKKLSTYLNKANKKRGEIITDINSHDDYISDITFTGGSSGTHKGVMLKGKGLSAVTKGADYVLPLNPGDTFLGNLPEFMAFGAFAMQYALNRSLTIHLTSKAMPQDFANELYRTKPNGVFGGPIQWNAYVDYVLRTADLTDIYKQYKELSKMGTEEQKHFYELVRDSLSKLDKETKEKLDMSFLKSGVTGGEQLTEKTETLTNIVFDAFGGNDELYNGLGMTEMWAPVGVKRGKLNTNGTIGHMLPFVGAKIVDPVTFEEVPKGKTGILMVTGPGMMTGYYNNQEETNKVITYDENGTPWLNSGDIASIDPVTNEKKFVDRQKRSFVCGVENVYPQQIEDLLSTIPEIKESIVTKIPNDNLQFVPKYHLSLVNREVDIKNLEDRVNTLIYGTLGEAKLPHYIEYHQEGLPKSANGKLAWNVLQAQDNEKYAKDKLEQEINIKTLKI